MKSDYFIAKSFYSSPLQDYLDICDPVLTFDRVMGEIELEKYLDNKSKMTQISQYELQKGNWKEEID